ncbi:MAG: DUF1553 domain-containing protein [Fimbriiglobus sp.]
MHRLGRNLAYVTFTVFSWLTPVLAAPPDPLILSTKIDGHLARRWENEKIQPAVQVDDAGFARRVYLDLAGRIPTVAEVREFLNDKSLDKRAKLVDRLLNSGAHFRHTATFWRREWIPQTDTLQFTGLTDEVDGWLAAKLRDGEAYDRIVRELLTVQRAKTGPGTPATFLSASENKPENLAANTTRAFLGINLDCAQCHDHPFARWSRDQFWQTAAFFARPYSADGKPASKLELTIPNTKRTVESAFLTETQPKWPASLQDDTGRLILANWVTARDNPYFAKNAVNRVWANLFGTGIVEPLDDLSGQNPASHPELLDELAKAFVESDFNLTYLTKAIVMTKAYQLSSVGTAQVDPRLFARAAVRGLTGEQLYDSLCVAAGMPPERDDLDSASVIRERKQFADKFRVERAGSAERSILQALSLMNGKLTLELSHWEKNRTLRTIAHAPFLKTPGKVEALYHATLSRYPTAEEISPHMKYIEKGGTDSDPQKAMADIFWALLNSTEFNTNH